MDFREQLSRIAGRLKIDTDDPRHTVLDLSDDFAAVASNRNDFSPALREEVGQILEELEQIQPQFKSHRKTSILFDREGLSTIENVDGTAMAGWHDGRCPVAICLAAQRSVEAGLPIAMTEIR